MNNSLEMNLVVVFFFFATAQWFSGSKPSNQHEIIFSLVSISKVEFGNENLALVPI